MFQTLNEYSTQTFGIALNAFIQITLFVAIVTLVVWAVLFSNYPPVHDFFHELRHALYVIPCH